MSLKKIEQLIALACSTTHEEEARTSALLAIRMIKKEEIQLSEKAVAKPTGPGPFYNWDDLQSHFSNVAREQAAHEAKVRAAYEAYSYAYGVDGERAYRQDGPVRAPPDGTWVTLKSAVPIECIACSNYINPGGRCYVDKRKRIWCDQH